MIQVHVFRKGEEVRDVPVAELSEVRAEPRTLVWVDLVSPTPDELSAMGEEFQVHELALASCAVGSKQRPRVEEFEGQVLLIAYASKPVAEGEPVDLRELDVIAGQNFLLTFHGGAPINAETVAGRITARPELAKHGAGFLLYVVLDGLTTPSSRPWTRSASGSRTWRRRCLRPPPATPRARSSPSGAT
jgi:magnesium transporter